MYDVVVIGGGPAGSQVAHRLARMGHRVVVLEQKERLEEPVCCTGIISQECVSSFAIEEDVILRRVNSAKVFSPSGKMLSLRRSEPQACVVDRPALNLTLGKRAQGSGAEYVLNSQVSDIEVKNDKVGIVLASHGGGSSFFETRAVVIATGFSSRLMERLGQAKVSDFVMGAQAEVKTKVDEVEVYLGQEIAPGFFGWLVPTSPQRGLVGLLSRRSPGLYLKKLVSSLLAQGKVASAEVELSYGGIPLKPLSRSYGDRVIVVGSAAGQVKPTTGGGIYYGLLCAEIAAESLHRALESDNLSARKLAGYQREWKGRLGQELRIGYWARRLYELLNDAQIERIFDIIRSNGIDETLLKADDLSFDWHGRVVVRLVGYQTLSRAIKATRFPFTLGGRR